MADAPAPAVEFELPAVPVSTTRARRLVRRLAEGVVADPFAVDLAVTEAVSNVVLHAYRDRRGPGSIHVSARVEADCMVVEVADRGVGLSPRADSPGLGLGLALIAQQADGLDVQELQAGTRVIMRFRRRAVSG
jgi:serine/threonine-protein kinase RsbW